MDENECCVLARIFLAVWQTQITSLASDHVKLYYITVVARALTPMLRAPTMRMLLRLLRRAIRQSRREWSCCCCWWWCDGSERRSTWHTHAGGFSQDRLFLSAIAKHNIRHTRAYTKWRKIRPLTTVFTAYATQQIRYD